MPRGAAFDLTNRPATAKSSFRGAAGMQSNIVPEGLYPPVCEARGSVASPAPGALLFSEAWDKRGPPGRAKTLALIG